MTTYRIKASEGISAVMEIVSENSKGLYVRIIREQNDYVTEEKDFLTREMFETCLRTGYLKKCDSSAKKMTA